MDSLDCLCLKRSKIPCPLVDPLSKNPGDAYATQRMQSSKHCESVAHIPYSWLSVYFHHYLPQKLLFSLAYNHEITSLATEKKWRSCFDALKAQKHYHGLKSCRPSRIHVSVSVRCCSQALIVFTSFS